jgi:hypothetical protein
LHLFREGAAKWGGFALEEDSFVRHASAALEKRLHAAGVQPSPESLERAISALPAADFYLAIAFRHGDRERARAVLHAHLEPLLRRGYRRLGIGAEQAETWSAELLESLLFGAFRRSGEPAFLTYEAQTSIESWASGVVWFDLRSRARATARHKVLAEADLGGRDESAAAPTREANADARRERQAELEDLAPTIRRALDEAAASGAVPARDLEAYVYAVLSRRQHQELAARLGIPPSTFSRRRERGEQALAAAAKDALLLRLKPAEYLRLQQGLELELSAAHAALLETTRAFCRAQRRRFGRRVRPPSDSSAPLRAQELP